ncbi:WS/DGAT/MGAT family O-acyltransferase [Nocardia farcinica]
MSHAARVSAQRLHPRDAVFVYDETDTHPSTVVGCYACTATTPLTETAVLDWVRDRLGLAPLFHRRLRRVPLDLDLPYWVPHPDPDLRAHVSLRTGGTWDDARRVIAELAATPMDLARPPWEIHVLDLISDVPGLPGETTVVVLKFHHGAADGVATRELELKLFGPDPLPPPPTFDRTPWLPSAALRTASALTVGTARFAAGLRRTRTTEPADLPPPLPTRPATRFNRPVHRPLVFDLVTLPLADIRRARAASDTPVTLNDLLLTTVSLALGDYLAERGELPAGSLAAMVPMSVRGIGWTSANQLCQRYVDLHTDVPDPLVRLAAVHRSAAREKQRNVHPDVLRAESRVETAPAWLLRLAGWARARRDYRTVETVPLMNTTVSNVPPVATDLAFLGRPVTRIFGVLPTMDGDCLRHLVTSQGEEVVISFSTDETAMPDPRHYGDLLRAAFVTLRDRLVDSGDRAG